MSIYNANRQGAVQASIDADLLASAIQTWMFKKEYWEGTPTDLLTDLENISDERTIKAKAWPKTASLLSRKIKRSITFLRSVGIEIEYGKSGDRTITIRKTVQNTVLSVHVAQSSVNAVENPDGKMDGKDSTDGKKDDNKEMLSGLKRPPDAGLDGKDGKDGKKQIYSKDNSVEEYVEEGYV